MQKQNIRLILQDLTGNLEYMKYVNQTGTNSCVLL